MVKSVVTGIPSNHYFTRSVKVKDASIEGLSIKIYKRDFIEPQLQHRDNKISINCD